MNETVVLLTTQRGPTKLYRNRLVFIYKRPLIYTQPVGLYGQKLYSYLLSKERTTSTLSVEPHRSANALNTAATENIVSDLFAKFFPYKKGEAGEQKWQK